MSVKPWGGAFDEQTDPRVEKFTESISFDHRLAAVDIRGSQAHARMLAKVGLLTADECRQIVETLAEIGGEIARGEMVWKTEPEDEQRPLAIDSSDSPPPPKFLSRKESTQSHTK